MTLSEEARSRLADVVALQPTKNADLQARWGMESGSEVHAYLEGELKQYYYRDDNSLIRATEDAAELVDVEPGIEDGEDGAPRVVRLPALGRAVVEVLDGPEEPGMSVVATLHALREAGEDPGVDEVRSTLKSLAGTGAVETVRRAVPTYRLAVPREELEIHERDEGGREAPA
jgi:hypothetical protein